MLNHDPAAKTHDRIGFTLSMAIALHVAVVLGLGFAVDLPSDASSTRMDITLSNYKSDQEIYDADFVAQTNQEASGSESTKRELKTTELAPINDTSIKSIQDNIEIPKQQTAQQSLKVITTTSPSQNSATQEQPKNEKELEEDLLGEEEILRRKVELASLQAKLDIEEQIYARLPRIRRATSVATKAADDAAYLFDWQNRIESIGNEHYPQQAKEQELFGDVRVLVSINKDGSLKDARILESSGIKVLDDAALKIVRLSNPFKPFPAKIKKTTDVLEIVRTWQFRQDRFSRLDESARNENLNKDSTNQSPLDTSIQSPSIESPSQPQSEALLKTSGPQ